MFNSELIKERSIYFIKYVLLISLVLILFNFILTIIIPYVGEYKEKLLRITDFIMSNLSTFIFTLALVIVLFFAFKSIFKKIRFLFSEETTDKDIYEESLEEWKEKNYDIVYENMSYIYEMSQKENIHNLYTETAKAILLFQKTDFSNESLSKHEILPIINALLNTYKYKELYLNTTHLAYAFLHFLKVEDDINKKAIYHLICSFLFNRVDPVRYKSRIEIELRIFKLYFEQYGNSISNLVSNEILQIMNNTQTNLSEDLFKEKVIPFLTEQATIYR
ncbi:hypothetical protein [Cytobacillus gottheilii]|uniref:hypothetical protein n=1 Tax=Cytobacillus gottheilii TaxID=859144 RepID=UPI0009BC690B|nr:hypothetical protein [Cytobacillus gottheilii]